MSAFKNNKKLYILVLALFLIGGGAYYFTSILSSQLETLITLREQNIVKENQLKGLEEQLKTLPEKEKQIKEMEMEINSINNQIPSYQVPVTMIMEVIQYMDIYNFEDTEIVIGEVSQPEGKDDFYSIVPVTINYTTTYDKTTEFIEGINRSSQIVTIESLEIDNRIQETDLEDKTRIIPNDWVEVKVVLSLYYKEDDEILTYPNYVDFFDKEENVFLNPEAKQEGIISKTSEVEETLVSQKPSEDSLFDINLADIYRSGDNYSFSAYSPNQDPVYVGLTSGRDAKIYLTIKNNSYTCIIEDIDGKRSEKTVDIDVENPRINITSQIQKVTTEMPVVSIYVYNHTENVVDIKMRGSELQNILIYNENNTLVSPGKRVGKVALKI